MSLEIVLGDAGSGKSTDLLEEIIREAQAHPDSRFLLLVPEQFCLSTQRKLVDRHPRHALINIEALSFDRLAARCFRELHVDTARVLSETAKTMLLSLAVRDCRGKLQVYEKQSAYPAFVRRLSSLLAEWTMNDLGPERIRELSEEVESRLLSMKLQDLALFYEAFRKRLGERQTAEEILPLFSRLLPASSVARVDHLYLDGFTGFTSVQYRILEQLLRRCPHTRVILTLPPEENTAAGSENDLFYLSCQTIERLERCAEAAGQNSHIQRTSESLTKKEEMAALRQYLFRRVPAVPLKTRGDALQLIACETPEDEAAMAAYLVRYLVQEKKLRYRDIAITVSDQNLYLPLLKREFKEKNIPYFSDRREPLAHHPLIRLVLDALEAVSDNLPREKLLKLVKNPCSPLNREEGDFFENYLLAAGIRRGKDFREPFTRTRRARGPVLMQLAEQERAEAEAMRQRIMGALQPLEDSFRRGTLANAGAVALKRFLADWGLGRQLESLEQDFMTMGEEGASWTEAIGQLDAFLTHMEGILGDMPLSRREFSDLVGASLEGLSCGRLPMSPDQLILGDIMRSRLGDIKTLIFLGMNEGLVPKNRSESRLLTDRERMELGRLEQDLGYTDQRAMSEERFYLYCLLQKPTESLYISYAQRGGQEEKEKLPAFTVQEIQRILPSFKPCYYKPREGFLLTERDSMLPIRLSEESVEKLYGNTLYSSISGLEQFVNCPFQFFLKRGLGLEKRQELEWQSSDHGTLFHKVAELLLRDMTEQDLMGKTLSEADRKGLVASALNRAVQAVGLPGEKDSPETVYNLRRWQHFFETYCDYLLQEGLQDGFLPDSFEVEFGKELGRDMARIPLQGGKSLQLTGVLDRVDLREEKEGSYLRVVDYKTYKSADFSPVALVEGKQLQLPVYLYMILRQYGLQHKDKSYIPGGIAYESLAEQLVDWNETGRGEKNPLWDKLGLHGVSALELAEIEYDEEGNPRQPRESARVKSSAKLIRAALFARQKVEELGEALMEGDVTPAPWNEGFFAGTSCNHCDFPKACPFQDKKQGCSYRVEKGNSAEAWAHICEDKEPDSKEDEKEQDHAVQP